MIVSPKDPDITNLGLESEIIVKIISLVLPFRASQTLGVKNSLANAGDIRDTDLIPGLGRSPGGGHSHPLQYSCLENALDRGSWWATVHGVAKSQT